MKDITFALRVAWSLWRERKNYQIVYFLMQGLHLAAGLPVARLLGKPIIMKFGASGVIPLMRGSRAGRFELDWLNRWASRLMVLNQGMVDEVISDGFLQEQLFGMPNPTDTNQFHPAADGAEKNQLRQQLSLPVDARIVLYVGRLSPEKGLPWLLESFAVVWRQMPQALLVLCGDGPQRTALTTQANSLGIPQQQIIFAGLRPVAEVALWCRAADFFALTSPSEGFSCALAEGMASGLPSVVSDIPANRQLILNEENGLLVPTAEISAIAAALQRLLASVDLCNGLGQAARQRIVDHYSLDKVVSLYEN
ncbi:glycosyltransferase [Bryobacter aggregatus]|uniref:glycosyltransferase n=1 Tax=Bryobacter aggregatus TaxID=360054 RepID=UPI0004E196D2|nr:glycosyltransferase [Bryobacter aggregatus]